MTGRPRHNIARLPLVVRDRIAELLLDGATYEEIREDGTVADACRERGVRLHDGSFAAFRESEEFDEARRSRLKYAEELRRRRMAAFFVSQSGGSDDLARIAGYELLRAVLGKLEASEELDIRELSAISSALAAYERNRLTAARTESRQSAALREKTLQARITELNRQLETLRRHNEQLRAMAGNVDGIAVAEAMDREVGL